MEIHKPIPNTLKTAASLLFLALTITCVTSARILNEDVLPAPAIAPPAPKVVPESPLAPVVAPEASNPVKVPVADVAPVVTPATIKPNLGPAAASTATNIAPVATPATTQPNLGPAAASTATNVAPVATPATTQPNLGPTATSSATMANTDPHHPLSFFMHDILGGSNPSALAVTGIVTNPAVNGQVPFAKPNGAVLPINNGIPINNGNNGIINNNNNIPFLAGLGGSTTSTIIQNNGNNNFINGGFGAQQSGPALQKLTFGTMTVIDDELTEGHEMGSGLVGKAQGFYVASSEDGSSQTMAFTAMLEHENYADSISFFGVHRIAVSESQLAIMGGTGKYVNAKGYATVKTIPSMNQHTTDGVETLLQITVYLSY